MWKVFEIKPLINLNVWKPSVTTQSGSFFTLQIFDVVGCFCFFSQRFCIKFYTHLGCFLPALCVSISTAIHQVLFMLRIGHLIADWKCSENYIVKNIILLKVLVTLKSVILKIFVPTRLFLFFPKISKNPRRRTLLHTFIWSINNSLLE